MSRHLYRDNPYRYGAASRPPSAALPIGTKWTVVARGSHPDSAYPARTDLPVSDRFAYGEIELERQMMPEDAKHFGLVPLGGEPDEDERAERMRASRVADTGEEEWMGKPVALGDERKFGSITMRCIYCLLDDETKPTLENCQQLGGLLESDDELQQAAADLPPAIYRAHLVYAIPSWQGWNIAKVCKTSSRVRVE